MNFSRSKINARSAAPKGQHRCPGYRHCRELPVRVNRPDHPAARLAAHNRAEVSIVLCENPVRFRLPRDHRPSINANVFKQLPNILDGFLGVEIQQTANQQAIKVAG